MLKKTILIIDDDPDCSLYLEKTLPSGHFDVKVASTGKEGLELAEKGPFEALLVDISLPDINGIEVARRLRVKLGNTIPIIGITCTPLDTLKLQYPVELIHFSDICIKPFGFQTILALLQKSNYTAVKEKNSFQQLILEYQASIPDRIELLRGLMFEIKQEPTDKKLSELRLQVHKLAGNAGIYGYAEVSKVCKEFDQLLGEHITLFRKDADTSSWHAIYEKYLQEIRKSFAAKDEAGLGVLSAKLIEKTAVVGVIGLGNIGISLLDAFGRAGFPLLGYDVSEEKMKMLNNKQSYLNYMDMSHLFKMLDEGRFKASHNPAVLKEADVLIISVPTSIDQYGTPNLSNLRAAFQTVASHLRKHQLVVLQSSTYPGTTQEELLPILLKSKLNVGIDFYLAHVPEIADIGNENFNFVQMPRIVSGITPSCVKKVSLLYSNVSSRIIPCSSTNVAEAAKLLQNAFRLVNISFVNEMKMLFDTMDMDVWEVIAAAATKPFGFMPFYPSPAIGGDCIPIAPFYLVWKAKSTNGPATLLEDAGRINNNMPNYVVNKLIYGLNLNKKSIQDAKILVLGVSYKKDVNDTRESPALKIIPLLKEMLADVSYHDPYIAEYPELSMQSIELNYNRLHEYDAVLVLTDHTAYDWNAIVQKSNLIIDTRNISSKVIDKRKIIKA